MDDLIDNISRIRAPRCPRCFTWSLRQYFDSLKNGKICRFLLIQCLELGHEGATLKDEPTRNIPSRQLERGKYFQALLCNKDAKGRALQETLGTKLVALYDEAKVMKNPESTHTPEAAAKGGKRKTDSQPDEEKGRANEADQENSSSSKNSESKTINEAPFSQAIDSLAPRTFLAAHTRFADFQSFCNGEAAELTLEFEAMKSVYDFVEKYMKPEAHASKKLEEFFTSEAPLTGIFIARMCSWLLLQSARVKKYKATNSPEALRHEFWQNHHNEFIQLLENMFLEGGMPLPDEVCDGSIRDYIRCVMSYHQELDVKWHCQLLPESNLSTTQATTYSTNASPSSMENSSSVVSVRVSDDDVAMPYSVSTLPSEPEVDLSQSTADPTGYTSDSAESPVSKQVSHTSIADSSHYGESSSNICRPCNDLPCEGMQIRDSDEAPCVSSHSSLEAYQRQQPSTAVLAVSNPQMCIDSARISLLSPSTSHSVSYVTQQPNENSFSIVVLGRSHFSWSIMAREPSHLYATSECTQCPPISPPILSTPLHTHQHKSNSQLTLELGDPDSRNSEPVRAQMDLVSQDPPRQLDSTCNAQENLSSATDRSTHPQPSARLLLKRHYSGEMSNTVRYQQPQKRTKMLAQPQRTEPPPLFGSDSQMQTDSDSHAVEQPFETDEYDDQAFMTQTEGSLPSPHVDAFEYPTCMNIAEHPSTSPFLHLFPDFSRDDYDGKQLQGYSSQASRDRSNHPLIATEFKLFDEFFAPPSTLLTPSPKHSSNPSDMSDSD